MVINNVYVFGLPNAVKGSKFPMSTDIGKLNSDITKTVHRLSNCESGSGHDNFLKGIVVEFDLTFTNKAWVEAERYHFFDFVSSQSTMHRISSFELDNQYIEYVDKRIIEIMKELQSKYNETKSKEDLLALLYSNPSGFKLTAKMVTNYQQLKTIYYQRKNHRLPEWVEFCEQISNLPYFKSFVLGIEEEDNSKRDYPYANYIQIESL